MVVQPRRISVMLPGSGTPTGGVIISPPTGGTGDGTPGGETGTTGGGVISSGLTHPWPLRSARSSARIAPKEG
jgi:hypothetical protein